MTFEGRVWRYLPAGAHPLHFHHLIHAGGRWNRRGLYGCLYTALTPSGEQATGDDATDLEACRDVADWARTHGFVALLAPSAALKGDRVLAIYPENAPRHLRLLETGVRHPLNYGDRALLDARGELRWPR